MMKGYTFVSDEIMFYCDDGWMPLIEEMFGEMHKLVDSDPVKYSNFSVVEVKEKFGTLRCYFAVNEDGYEDINKIVEKYTTRSAKTCEICGRKGELREKGSTHWLKTLCRRHYEEWEME